ncbi:MAG: metallophosphoesterase family protein [Desulfitobacteriaceae bacterium]
MIRKLSILLLLTALSMGGSFLLYAYSNYKIHADFSPLPLAFDPYTSTSVYNWDGTLVTVEGGFVKGKMKENDGQESLLLRALAPTSKIRIKGSTQIKNILVRLENVNPATVGVSNPNESFQVIDPHTILLKTTVAPTEEKSIELTLKEPQASEFVILGDNRNGYKTFGQIIDQINSFRPAFVIDNGDLVFGGEPNRYRLFYETVAKLQVPLYTTLGNHDIRENGRPIYTELFGPPYYSFDHLGTHFVFLDSSRGWTEKRAIPEEQYQWLESDLQKAQGKRILVITHIPSSDPRANLQFNTYPEKPQTEKNGLIEQQFQKLSGTNNLDHAFPDKEEAKRFEGLMTKYGVDTVYLSHIHAFFNYTKDKVNYIISGGAGAELLTKDSYYHYIRVNLNSKNNYLTVIQLPSPPNALQDRYLAALGLFASATYKEYRPLVLGIGTLIALLLGWLLWLNRHRWWHRVRRIGLWLYHVLAFAVAEFRNTVLQKKRAD